MTWHEMLELYNSVLMTIIVVAMLSDMGRG